MTKITVDQWHALRGRLYAVLAVLGPLLAFYGVASSAEYALWVGVVAAGLGNGLAATNVVLQRRRAPVTPAQLAHLHKVQASVQRNVDALRAGSALNVEFTIKGSDLIAVIDKHRKAQGR